MCMYKPVHVSVRAVEAGILGWVTGLLSSVRQKGVTEHCIDVRMMVVSSSKGS
jgi:hypothetical protein